MRTTPEQDPTTMSRKTAGPADAPGASVAAALDAFTKVVMALEKAPAIDDLMRVIARELAELIGVERCSVHLRDEKAGLFRGCVGHAPNGEIDTYVKRMLAGMPTDGMTLEMLRTRRPVVVADAHRDPRIIKSTVRFWSIRSMMAVPMLSGSDVIGVMYLDDVDRPHHFSEADAELSTAFAQLAAAALTNAQDRIELSAKLVLGRRQIEALRSVAAVDDRLSNLVLAGSTIAELTDTLAQLLGKPCAVYDADNRCLAAAGPPGTAQGMLPQLLEPPCVTEPEVLAALAEGGDTRVFPVGPLPTAGVRHRHLVAPIRVLGESWGHLLVMEHRKRFSGGDMLTVRRAATLVALQMSTERRVVEADWNGSASLASELLDGGFDPELVRRRAQRLGLSLDTPHVVAVVGRRDVTAHNGDFRRVAVLLEELAPELTAHVTGAGNDVAVLIQLPAGVEEAASVRALKDLFADVCERLGGGAHYAAAVSTARCHATEYVLARDEAQQVLSCVRHFGCARGPSVFTAAELGTGRVFLASSDVGAVSAFADATFGNLIQDPSKVDMLTTLSCFFENMASIRRCALHLGVHENTIRYRLARIEELTGLAVTHDPDGQLGARLSLLVLTLRGSLPTSVPVHTTEVPRLSLSAH